MILTLPHSAPSYGAPSPAQLILGASYLKEISKILSGTQSESSCSQCTSTFQLLHEAALALSPSDIADLLIALCQEGYSLFNKNNENCRNLYGGSASDGPYMAKLFYTLNNKTQDMLALCTYKFGVDCAPPPVVQIDESQWFSPKPNSQNTNPIPSGQTTNIVHMSDFHLDSR